MNVVLLKRLLTSPIVVIVGVVILPSVMLLSSLLYLGISSKELSPPVPSSKDFPDSYYNEIVSMLQKEGYFAIGLEAASLDWQRWRSDKRGDDSPSEAEFGFGWLDRWADSMVPFCNANAVSSSSSSSSLHCAVHTQTRISKESHPHTFCVGSRIFLDLRWLHRAGCPKHRPHYHCDIKTFFQYDTGAFYAADGCVKDPSAFNLKSFPKDHLRDIFDSFASEAPLDANVQRVQPRAAYTIFHTREIREHSNLFHTMTDWMNVFSAMYMNGVVPEHVQLVLLDDHPKSPFDGFWSKLFSPKHPVLRPKEIWNHTIETNKVVFAPPGYSSFMLADLMRSGAPKTPLKLITAFVEHVSNSLHINRNTMLLSIKNSTRIVLISRRGDKIDRQISNEKELCTYFRNKAADAEVLVVDLARLSLTEQIGLISSTDILIGMHGAALTLLMFLPSHAAVIEVWHQGGQWRCFEHLAGWTGVGYFRVRNVDSANYYLSSSGWTLNAPLNIFDNPFAAAIRHVTALKIIK